MEELAVEGEYSRDTGDTEDSLALVVSAPFLFAFFWICYKVYVSFCRFTVNKSTFVSVMSQKTDENKTWSKEAPLDSLHACTQGSELAWNANSLLDSKSTHFLRFMVGGSQRDIIKCIHSVFSTYKQSIVYCCSSNNQEQ